MIFWVEQSIFQRRKETKRQRGGWLILKKTRKEIRPADLRTIAPPLSNCSSPSYIGIWEKMTASFAPVAPGGFLPWIPRRACAYLINLFLYLRWRHFRFRCQLSLPLLLLLNLSLPPLVLLNLSQPHLLFLNFTPRFLFNRSPLDRSFAYFRNPSVNGSFGANIPLGDHCTFRVIVNVCFSIALSPHCCNCGEWSCSLGEGLWENSADWLGRGRLPSTRVAGKGDLEEVVVVVGSVDADFEEWRTKVPGYGCDHGCRVEFIGWKFAYSLFW